MRTEQRARRLREEGSLLTNSGNPAAGARKLRAALRLLRWSPDLAPEHLEHLEHGASPPTC